MSGTEAGKAVGKAAGRAADKAAEVTATTGRAADKAADKVADKAAEAKAAAEANLPLDIKISSTRAELEQTLDAIGDKLNVPKRLGLLGAKASDAYHVNPTPFLVGAAAGVISIVGAIALRMRSNV